MLILHRMDDGLVVAHVEALEAEHEHLPDLDFQRCVRDHQRRMKGVFHGRFLQVAERGGIDLREVLCDERRVQRAVAAAQCDRRRAKRGLA
ncbi:MAG: hypothetical protein KDE01_21835 [Caldilineaceae bacterium]|nr:hypothetical protein [Caldilineaceae bacterium]